MFSGYHFAWLGICVVTIFLLVYFYDRKRPSLKKVLTSALAVSILSEVVKVLSVIEMVPSANGNLILPYLPLNHLPLHFCSIQIILITYVRFTKNDNKREAVLAFMYPTCTLGAAAALLMPSIFSGSVPVEKAFISPMAYQFFVFHAMLLALGLIIARSGTILWQRKHYKQTLLMVYMMGLATIYLNSIFAVPTYVDGKLQHVDFWTNFFFTYQNPLNIRITELWQWVLYLVIIVALTAILLYLSYWPYIRKNQEKQQSVPTN